MGNQMMTGDYIVHVVDDEEAVRKSLAFLLTTAGFTVRMHKSAAEFLDVAKDLENCCLVTDLRMPGIDGVELLRRLKSDHKHIPSIVITGHGDVPMAVEAMKAGALDFIEKPFADDVLIDAIRLAALQIAGHLSDRHDASAIKERLELLSDREREVLAGVVAGLPNKTIAYDLNISPRTVEVHRANVMQKMQAKSLPELVRQCIAAGSMSS
jgi:two-component system, LuxR family, response regulator FixJ